LAKRAVSITVLSEVCVRFAGWWFHITSKAILSGETFSMSDHVRDRHHRPVCDAFATGDSVFGVWGWILCLVVMCHLQVALKLIDKAAVQKEEYLL
jgi:hypothetical protein